MPEMTIQQEIAAVEERHASVPDPVERKEIVAATLFPSEPISLAVTKYEYLVDFGRFLDLDDPKDIAAKLHWLKLYYRNPILGELVDKLAARAAARRKCPNIALPDLYWEGPGLSAVAPAKLPKNFVLKANHGWNMNLFCNDADSFDWADASARTNEWLKFRHERMHGEWAYGSKSRPLELRPVQPGQTLSSSIMLSFELLRGARLPAMRSQPVHRQNKNRDTNRYTIGVESGPIQANRV